jgi:hypothetical protein
MNSLIICNEEINVKEDSTRERLEMRKKMLVGMIEEWALPGSLGRGSDFSIYVCILRPGFM